VSTPITFSGFNSIDFNTILNAVMTQESQPMVALQNQQSDLKTQNSAFGTLVGKLTTLGNAADALKDSNSLAKLTANSSDAGVGVSSTGGSVPGTYAVSVTALARAQVTASQSTYTSATATVGTGGQLTIQRGTDDPYTVTLSGSTTLQQLADTINGDETSPATASIVQTTPGHYQLVLTASDTGVANAFTVQSTITGGEGLTYLDNDGDGTAGSAPSENAQSAGDAAFTVNGLAVTSSSNTVTDVVPGVTLTLSKQVDAIVRVSRDTDGVKALVKNFMDAYNAVVQFTTDQQTAATNGDVSIARDPLLHGFRDNMRQALLGQYSGGAFDRLASVGIGFDRNGKMVLDSATFDKAMSTNSADVQKLFSGASGDAGAFGAIGNLLDEYTKTGGLVATVRSRMDDEVARMSTRLDSMQAALDIKRQSLQQEYTAADMAMTQLKSQAGSLSNLGSGMQF
jgi:flagellar hook-associated protein 2